LNNFYLFVLVGEILAFVGKQEDKNVVLARQRQSTIKRRNMRG